ncbi:transposase IS4 family protein [Thiorhodococcus drewsii AZ1]|uniref:Transposase IS4 family protein n=2 Tax=Thiorhodococcus drewsii TaxID=210408 RepID=G2E8M3_9GAMM|nr:transposase IS4 family protein [Thiorhodococcus drewsii AZ1]
MLTSLRDRFATHFPIPTMARALLERSFHPERLNAWFKTVAQGQYNRKQLFSTLFELMMQVVTRQQPSVHAAYQGAPEPIPVSLKAVYDTLNGLEPEIASALVDDSGEQATSMITALGGSREPLVSGYRVKILDGNALGGREHRLQESRGQCAAPLPGKALAELEPALGLITHLIAEPDAYTQERALLPQLESAIEAGDLWIADRNFCVASWIWTLHQREAAVLVREHQQIPLHSLEPLRPVGRSEQGVLSEQRVTITAPDGQQRLELRRIRLELSAPTRDGETQLYVLTTLPAAVVDAAQVATLYHKRWRVEEAFLHVTTELRCELETLAYPSAALFGLAMAIVAYNALAVLKAALHQVHGAETIGTELSGYYIVNEMGRVSESLETLVEPEDWAVFQTLTTEAIAAWLLATAQHVQLRKYRKHPRGPKKPTPARTHDPANPHVSVARVLAQRQKAKKMA